MKGTLVFLTAMVGAALCLSSVCWGQAYMDKGYGNAGCVEGWKPIELGEKPIAVSCRPGLGARLGYFFPYSNDNVESDIAYEGIIAYAVSNVFATALTVGYTRPEFLTPVAGHLELTYLNLSFELRGEPEPNFGLYLGFGPSLYLTNFDPREDIKVRTDDAFGLHVSLGIDYFVLQSLAINIDVKHMWYLDDFKYRINDEKQPKEALDSMVFSAGLKYFF